jgi:hypothetical protein
LTSRALGILGKESELSASLKKHAELKTVAGALPDRPLQRVSGDSRSDTDAVPDQRKPASGSDGSSDSESPSQKEFLEALEILKGMAEVDQAVAREGQRGIDARKEEIATLEQSARNLTEKYGLAECYGATGNGEGHSVRGGQTYLPDGEGWESSRVKQASACYSSR